MDNLAVFNFAPVYRAKISQSASGDVVAAQPGKSIRVLQYLIRAAGAVDVNFEDGTTDISGVASLPANGGEASGFCPVGIFETPPGNALKLTLGSSVQVSGWLVYQIVG